MGMAEAKEVPRLALNIILLFTLTRRFSCCHLQVNKKHSKINNSEKAQVKKEVRRFLKLQTLDQKACKNLALKV